MIVIFVTVHLGGEKIGEVSNYCESKLCVTLKLNGSHWDGVISPVKLYQVH